VDRQGHGREGDVTALLHAWGAGDRGAKDALVPLVYEDLRRRAAVRLRRERRSHTLQPTALVHETYLRLLDQRQVAWQSRAHFFGIASEMMRRILVDHARRRKMDKRSGRWLRVSLTDDAAHTRAVNDVAGFDVLLLDTLINRFGTRCESVG
jgi:RNA polymerase sigma factor (TIGR02999 family)